MQRNSFIIVHMNFKEKQHFFSSHHYCNTPRNSRLFKVNLCVNYTQVEGFLTFIELEHEGIYNNYRYDVLGLVLMTSTL